MSSNTILNMVLDDNDTKCSIIHQTKRIYTHARLRISLPTSRSKCGKSRMGTHFQTITSTNIRLVVFFPNVVSRDISTNEMLIKGEKNKNTLTRTRHSVKEYQFSVSNYYLISSDKKVKERGKVLRRKPYIMERQ